MTFEKGRKFDYLLFLYLKFNRIVYITNIEYIHGIWLFAVDRLIGAIKKFKYTVQIASKLLVGV